MSAARRRGLLRLVAMLVAVAVLVALLSRLGGGSNGSTTSTSAGAPQPQPPPTPIARPAPKQLPAPVSGEAVTSEAGGGLLIVGGLDSSGVSTSGIFRLDPKTANLTSVGTLPQPLHDAAAATVPGGTVVFGGGSVTTTDQVEALGSGGTASVVGHLPIPRSDLSAVSLGRDAYVLGGYDGQAPAGPVLRTADGRRFATVGDLPTPVRYAAVATAGGTIYAFGGELASGGDSNAVQAIDPATHRSSVVARLPQPTSHASAVALGGRLYVLGGRVHGAPSDRILAFDPSRHEVSTAGRLPDAVTNAAAATSGRTAYLIGGLDAGGSALRSIIEVRLKSRR